LIEIIAVLAIIAILVAVIAPSVIRRVDRAAWTAETANLNNIAEALIQSILRTNTNKTIPGTNGWATAVASQMSLPVSTITTNARRFARAFLIDPNLRINGALLPYTNTYTGATNLVAARIMLVSSLARALPIATSIPTSAEFDAIWNTAEGAKPTTATWTTWLGTGEELRIKKLNLEPLFYQLILVDRAGVGARFSIDNNPNPIPAVVPPGGLGWKRYYLDGTVVGLHDANGLVQIRRLLKRNISFLFESDAWQGQFQSDEESFSTTGADFFNHAITFMNRRTNPWGAQGASQYGVIVSMYTFMFDYIYWANGCPHFAYHGNNASSVPEYVLLQNQGQNNGNVDRFSSGLITPH
jgi:type II secretory pathway pseudopilin PulG